ncbi:MAG: aminotransferase class V-fold PLP-dependent enzyme [Candidatus Peribacteria bacterium]|nr:MAG: aminotransferase class V-fold PLP-dependent enzyme [Candidatus Peribacteria bacterium]
MAEVTRDNYELQSDIHGREAGTPNVVGAVSLLAAIDYIDSIG